MGPLGIINTGPKKIGLGSDAIDSLPDYRTPRRLRPREMVRRYIDGSGQNRVCGGKHLRASQAYPKECFGIWRCFVFFRVGEEPTSILMNTHLLQPVPAQVWACHCKVSNAAQSTAPEAGQAVSEGCQKIYQFYGHQCPNQQDLEGWCQSGTSLNLFVQWQINLAMKIEVQIHQWALKCQTSRGSWSLHRHL